MAQEQHQPLHGKTENHPEETNDRAWARRLADEREAREIARHAEQKEIGQVTQAGVAKMGVDLDDLKTKVDAIFEKTCTPEPTTGFGKFIAKADAVIRRALPVVTVVGGTAAAGYGVVKGVQYVRRTMNKPDVTIQPVPGEVSVKASVSPKH